MDPLTFGIAAIGVGLSIFGGVDASKKAAEAQKIQEEVGGLEKNVNGQRENAMELDARRKSMELFRRTQQASAMSLNTATSQGAQFGSGYSGGSAEVESSGLFNISGINQNVEIGRNIFALNDQISDKKVALSKVQSGMATDQGIMSLGSSIFKSAGTVGNLAQGLGNADNYKINVPGFNPISGVAG